MATSGLDEERANAEVVCLNLSPGVVTVAQALRAVLSACRLMSEHRENSARRPVCGSRGAPRRGWSSGSSPARRRDLRYPDFKWDFYQAVRSRSRATIRPPIRRFGRTCCSQSVAAQLTSFPGRVPMYSDESPRTQ